jgi:hypothetical protein
VDTIARALQRDPTYLIDIANPLIAPSWALVEPFYRRRCKYGLHQRIYRTEDAHDRIVLSVDDIPRKRPQTVAFSFFCFFLELSEGWSIADGYIKSLAT